MFYEVLMCESEIVHVQHYITKMNEMISRDTSKIEKMHTQ